MGQFATFYIVTDWDYIALQETETEVEDIFYQASEYLSFDELPESLSEGKVPPHWCYLYKADFSLRYWKFTARAGASTYEYQIRPLLEDVVRDRADACLQALFWPGCEFDLAQQRDLEMREKNHVFELSIKPENVVSLRASLAELLQGFDHEEMQRSCDSSEYPDSTCSWQEWFHYLELWLALLEEASMKNAGILVTV